MSLSSLSARVLTMILIDGSYLYQLGKVIQPLYQIKKDSDYSVAWAYSYQAIPELEGFLTKSVYVGSLRLIADPAQRLLKTLKDMEAKGGFLVDGDSRNQAIGYTHFNAALSDFESIFQAEFRNGNMFLVTPKGGFETRALIENGHMLFPSALPLKAPNAIGDINQAAKCLAFEVYTASGFHLHRANESVIKHYYKHLTGKDFKESERNLGKYIQRLEEVKAPKHIRSCLRDLKDMHRNPLMHPDKSIESVDDAIALLNAIHTSINGMLKEIPDPEFGMQGQED